jgi:hypothetical protein
MTTYTMIQSDRSVIHCRNLTEFKRARMDAHREFIKAQKHKQQASRANEQQR